MGHRLVVWGVTLHIVHSCRKHRARQAGTRSLAVSFSAPPGHLPRRRASAIYAIPHLENAVPNAQPLATPEIMRYFWFFAAAIMALNVGFWRRRLLVAVDRGKATRAEVDSFLLWVGAWLVGAPIALGVSGLAAGWSSPTCLLGASASSPPMVTLAIVSVAGAAILLRWVWRGNGADFLARVGAAFQQRPDYDKVYAPASVRVYITFVVVLLVLSPVTTLVMPTSSAPDGCPVARTTGQ